MLYSTHAARTAIFLTCSLLAPSAFATAPTQAGSSAGSLHLTPCRPDGVREDVRCGTYEVFENREAGSGRKLPLKIVVVPARLARPGATPVFFLAGGPGETATEMISYVLDSPSRDEQDLVLVDERGTGDGHRLDCPSLGSDDDLQGYLRNPFDPAAARECRRALEQQFDLSRYTTPAFVEDLEDVRRAMGYERINLEAGSFGTYAALMYMRAHGDHVRSAFLTSLVTFTSRVPLYHAEAAQWGLDRLFTECEKDDACSKAYPRVREDFAAVLADLRKAPVRTWVRHPVSGAKTEVQLSDVNFADAVRVMTYSTEGARELPFLIHQARAGDFSAFAQTGMQAMRNMIGGLRLGFNLAISCNEFVSRIRPEEIEPTTRGSYFGSFRVANQLAVCKEWPRTHLPPDYFAAFRLDVPAVLVSGDSDPASLRRWAEELKASMPNSIHVVVPGGHMPDNDCTRAIRAQFFRTGSTKGLDLSCLKTVRAPPFKLPE